MANPKSPKTKRTDVSLSDDEVEVVLTALRKYRTTVPGYLKSRQSELALIDAVLEQLTALRSSRRPP